MAAAISSRSPTGLRDTAAPISPALREECSQRVHAIFSYVFQYPFNTHVNRQSTIKTVIAQLEAPILKQIQSDADFRFLKREIEPEMKEARPFDPLYLNALYVQALTECTLRLCKYSFQTSAVFQNVMVPLKQLQTLDSQRHDCILQIRAKASTLCALGPLEELISERAQINTDLKGLPSITDEISKQIRTLAFNPKTGRAKALHQKKLKQLTTERDKANTRKQLMEQRCTALDHSIHNLEQETFAMHQERAKLLKLILQAQTLCNETFDGIESIKISAEDRLQAANYQVPNELGMIVLIDLSPPYYLEFVGEHPDIPTTLLNWKEGIKLHHVAEAWNLDCEALTISADPFPCGLLIKNADDPTDIKRYRQEIQFCRPKKHMAQFVTSGFYHASTPVSTPRMGLGLLLELDVQTDFEIET